MERLYHVPAGSDRAAEVAADTWTEVRDAAGWVWRDVVGASAQEVEAIAADLGFDALAVEDILTFTEYPKADEYPDHTFVVLHGIADDPTRLRTVECHAFIGPDYLVTLHEEDLPFFESVREQVEAGRHADAGPDGLFALLAEAAATRYDSLAVGLEDEFESLEDRAMGGDPSVIAEVHALRRDALMLRRVTTAQRDTVRQLADVVFPGIGERARMRLGSARDHYVRAAESIDTSRAVLGAVLEAHRAAVAERTNEVMKVLTVFAAIVLPMTLLTGIYGMNFHHMPELAWRWGYFALLGVMAVLGIVLWIYFARRGFIGGPRLSRLPRALGKGVTGLVRSTVRPVSGLARLLSGEDRPRQPNRES
jgi:magnesium transporter